MQYGFPDGLAGYSPGIDANTAHHLAPLDHRDALSHFCALYCGALAGWAGSDDYEIETLHVKPI